jgi:4-amino-4-deoxy-L-arabinose transferase-like glycosyltransferase
MDRDVSMDLSARSSLGVLVLGTLLAAGVLLPGIDRPWPITQDGLNASRYAGAIERTWRLAGWTTCRGVPYLSCLPYDPPIPAPQSAYVTHPPLYRWALHAWVQRLGFAEWSVRLFSILPHALACGLIAWAASRCFGRVGGIVASLLAAVSPASVLFGPMANYEPGVLLFSMAALALHLITRERPWPHYIPVPLLICLGTLWDWSGAFVVVTIAVIELARGWSKARLGRVAACGTGALLAVASFVAWLAWAQHTSPGSVMEQMLSARHATQGEGVEFSLIQGVSTFAAQFFTLPVLGLAGIGFLVALLGMVRPGHKATRTTSDVPGLPLYSLLIGIINIAFFPAVAASHEFWIYLLLPGIILCAVGGARFLDQRSRLRMGTMLALAAAAFSGFQALTLSSSRHTSEAVEVARAIDAIAPPNALLAFPFILSAETFYMREPYVDMLLPSQVEGLVALTQSGTSPWERVTFVVPQSFLDANPPLADTLSRLGEGLRVTRPDVTEHPILIGLGAHGGLVLYTSVP